MPRSLRVLLTVAVAATFGTLTAGTASASAYGATPLPAFSYTDSTGDVKSVPYGCALIHSVIGEGLDITAQTANVDCAGIAAMRTNLLCDVRIDFTFRPLTGRTTTVDRVPLEGCKTLGIRAVNGEVDAYDAGGKTCARLYLNDEYIGQSCHMIGG